MEDRSSRSRNGKRKRAQRLKASGLGRPEGSFGGLDSRRRNLWGVANDAGVDRGIYHLQNAKQKRLKSAGVSQQKKKKNLGEKKLRCAGEREGSILS